MKHGSRKEIVTCQSAFFSVFGHRNICGMEWSGIIEGKEKKKVKLLWQAAKCNSRELKS